MYSKWKSHDFNDLILTTVMGLIDELFLTGSVAFSEGLKRLLFSEILEVCTIWFPRNLLLELVVIPNCAQK